MCLNKGLEKKHEVLDGGLSKGLVSSRATQLLDKLVQTSTCKRKVKKMDDGHPWS